MLDLTSAEVDAIYASGDAELQAFVLAHSSDLLYNFEPRPDCPEDFDEQTAFVNSDAKFAICLGGTGCIGAEQEVYDHAERGWRPVSEIDRPFVTISVRDGEPCYALANAPFCKGVAGLYRVKLSNGKEFISTLDHRVQLPSGEFTTVAELAHMVRRGVLAALYVPGATPIITSIEFVRFDKFYDFTVHGTSCYIAAGVVHHNSGKTIAGAYKTARYVLDNPPPRERCPFWVLGESYDAVCSICWGEKLSKLIPASEIHSYDWYKRSRAWPFAVMLRDPVHRDRVGWVLEFKSYEQGLDPIKGFSIGGYWCNEEVSLELVQEIQGRCRDYNSPGWADFTPIKVKSADWPERYEHPPEGWKFFHLNTLRNEHLADGWAESYLASLPEDMRELRQIGTFATFSGQVFKEFRTSIHVIEPLKKIPADWHRIRGIDFGFNNPFCCLWVARDRDGRYFVYDEHYESQKLHQHHAAQMAKREWPDNNPNFGMTYSDHDAQERAELTKYDIHCTPANKAINPGVECLRKLMLVQDDNRPRLFIYAGCKNLIREIRAYKWADGTSKTRNPKDLPVDKDNHAIDALRYAIVSDQLALGGGNLPQHRRIERQAGRHGVQLHRGGK